MTLSAKDQFQELVALSKLHLLRHYPKGHWKIADKECFDFFKREVKSNEQPKPQTVKLAPPALPPEQKLEPKMDLKPEPKAPPQKETIAPTWTFKTNPIGNVEKRDLSDMEKLIQQEMPELKLKDQTPNRVEIGAKQNQLTSVLVITDRGLPIEEQLLLSNIARAIDISLAKTRMVQPSQFMDEDSILSIILPKSSPLKDQIANKDKIFELEELSVYLNDPKAKASLWKTLSNKIKNPLPR